jgi:hypothetical protein
LKLTKQSVQPIQNKTIDDKDFYTLMLSHYSSGSWISILVICALSLAGVVAKVTSLVYIRKYFAVRGWMTMVAQAVLQSYSIPITQ